MNIRKQRHVWILIPASLRFEFHADAYDSVDDFDVCSFPSTWPDTFPTTPPCLSGWKGSPGVGLPFPTVKVSSSWVGQTPLPLKAEQRLTGSFHMRLDKGHLKSFPGGVIPFSYYEPGFETDLPVCPHAKKECSEIDWPLDDMGRSRLSGRSGMSELQVRPTWQSIHFASALIGKYLWRRARRSESDVSARWGLLTPAFVWCLIPTSSILCLGVVGPFRRILNIHMPPDLLMYIHWCQRSVHGIPELFTVTSFSNATGHALHVSFFQTTDSV